MVDISKRLRVPMFLSRFLVLHLRFLVRVVRYIEGSPSAETYPAGTLLSSKVVLIPGIVGRSITRYLIRVALGEVVRLLPRISVIVDRLANVLRVRRRRFYS